MSRNLGHTLRHFNHETGVYQVVTPYNDHRGGGGNHSHEVHVFAMKCGCGKWQNLKIPCSHAITVLKALHRDATSYIDPCYSLSNAIHTYSHHFVVPKSESLWRDVRGARWVPDPQLLRAKGRPVKSRLRNEMDGVRREGEAGGKIRLEGDSTEAAMRTVSSEGITAEAVPFPVGLQQVATHKNGTQLSFYTMPEYESWKHNLTGQCKWVSIKYYKGLLEI
ncbi:hypothetical protein CFP56_012063 [Quercus suber]|uniref:SWIM-type domain-containing protein n=1 Tax=Quercus suber TaxID=58331 RepID=A0AAW0KW65_QUESU